MSRRSMSSVERARALGLQVASREHASLQINLRRRIDIFDILVQRGIIVNFQSFDMYGAYLYEGNHHGVLINVKHPPNLQRFTAAHEYGHFVMQHGPSTDFEEQIFPSHSLNDVQEVEAQSFAANFLMPIQLLNATLQHMGLPFKPEEITPQEAYQLSLELGVSYGAVVNHLAASRRVSVRVANELRRHQPKTIKAAIGRGIGPQDSWADVWAFRERDNGRSIVMHLHDELHIYLPELADSTRTWNVVVADQDYPITFVESNLEISSFPYDAEREPSTLTRHFVFRAQLSGATTLNLVKENSASLDIDTDDLFELHLEIIPKQSQGLLQQQHSLL